MFFGEAEIGQDGVGVFAVGGGAVYSQGCFVELDWAGGEANRCSRCRCYGCGCGDGQTAVGAAERGRCTGR